MGCIINVFFDNELTAAIKKPNISTFVYKIYASSKNSFAIKAVSVMSCLFSL